MKSLIQKIKLTLKVHKKGFIIGLVASIFVLSGMSYVRNPEVIQVQIKQETKTPNWSGFEEVAKRVDAYSKKQDEDLKETLIQYGQQ